MKLCHQAKKRKNNRRKRKNSSFTAGSRKKTRKKINRRTSSGRGQPNRQFWYYFQTGAGDINPTNLGMHLNPGDLPWQWRLNHHLVKWNHVHTGTLLLGKLSIGGRPARMGSRRRNKLVGAGRPPVGNFPIPTPKSRHNITLRTNTLQTLVRKTFAG